MADTLFIVPFQIWVYGMIYNTAIRLWLADRSLLLAGLMIQVVTDWLVTELFGPALSEFVLLSQGLMPAFFTIAVFLLALGYLVAPFFKVRVVSLGKALGWLLFALLFYQTGPGLYVEGEQLRRSLSNEFYAMILDEAASASTATGPVGVMNLIAAGPDDAMGALANQFGAFVPTDTFIDGLDIAMAYTLATGDEVVFALTPMPADFEAEYFDPTLGPLFFLSMTADERTDSINAGLTGLSRLVLGSIIIFFGLFEQAIYLCLSLAAGILFISMSFAILFAFFERTELIARTLIDMWFELFILSVIIASLQAFIVGLVTVGARTLNPTMTLGASVIGCLVMSVLLVKAVGAIWDALNRMFKVMSETVGGGLMSPAEAATAAAGGAAGIALTVATAGAGAAVAAGAGASMAQVAGSALSGMDTLYSSAALGSFVLPDDSRLKGTAQGFYEGALSNRMMGPLGGLILNERSSSEGGLGSRSESGTSQAPPNPQTPAVASPSPASDPTPPISATVPAGETNIRLDSADLIGLREAMSTAMRQAVTAAPAGGYPTQEAALSAVRDSLGRIPSTASPTGTALSDPGMDAYLRDREHDIAAQVMQGADEESRTAPASSATAGAPDLSDFERSLQEVTRSFEDLNSSVPSARDTEEAE